MGDAVLVDTNIFLRLTSPNHPHHAIASHAIRQLFAGGYQMCYTLQIASEFWNACTRPASANGLGYTPYEAVGRLTYLERNARLLPDTSEVYAIWRKLVVQYSVQGIQVHDAKLVAAMRAHSIPKILTFNRTDFSRYDGIQVLEPANI